MLEQSFTLHKDPMVTLADAELKQLYAFRLSVASFQKTLREKQAQADTTAAESRGGAPRGGFFGGEDDAGSEGEARGADKGDG